MSILATDQRSACRSSSTSTRSGRGVGAVGIRKGAVDAIGDRREPSCVLTARTASKRVSSAPSSSCDGLSLSLSRGARGRGEHPQRGGAIDDVVGAHLELVALLEQLLVGRTQWRPVSLTGVEWPAGRATGAARPIPRPAAVAVRSTNSSSSEQSLTWLACPDLVSDDVDALRSTRSLTTRRSSMHVPDDVVVAVLDIEQSPIGERLIDFGKASSCTSCATPCSQRVFCGSERPPVQPSFVTTIDRLLVELLDPCQLVG